MATALEILRHPRAGKSQRHMDPLLLDPRVLDASAGKQCRGQHVR
jgi:hypothetical protein